MGPPCGPAGPAAEVIKRCLTTAIALFALVACSELGNPDPGAGPPGSLSDGVPSSSSPIALSPDGGTVWVVNPDADSVTPLDTTTLQAGEPVATGREPWAVAVTPAGTVVVMNRAGGSISLLTGADRIDVEVGPELGGLALSPGGGLAFVTVSSAAQVAVIDTSKGAVVARVEVGRLPWAIAVTDDGDDDDFDETVLVAHRQARPRA